MSEDIPKEQPILFNKLFNGDYVEKYYKTPHEIIDFLLSDQGEYYVYNSPHGDCPTALRNKELESKYMVLTTDVRNGNCQILGVIELDRKIHSCSSWANEDDGSPTNPNSKKKSLEQYRKAIQSQTITYGGKSLDDIFGKECLHITFRGNKFYKAKRPIDLPPGVYSRDSTNKQTLTKTDSLFADISSLIAQNLRDGNLAEYTLEKVPEGKDAKLFISGEFFQRKRKEFTELMISDAASMKTAPKGLNLEKGFKQWLLERGMNKAESEGKRASDSAGNYVRKIKSLAELIKELTGHEPKVGGFEVSGLRQFLDEYGVAISMAAFERDKKLLKDRLRQLDPYKNFTSFGKVFDYLQESPPKGDRGTTRNAFVKYLEFLCELVSKGEFPLDAGEVARLDIPPSELKDENGPLPRNLIYFGAPGTGKSFKLKEAVEAKRDEDGKPIERGSDGKLIKTGGKAIDYERVTFYPTYSYAQFVGCYKPVMKETNAGELKTEEIAYEFVPGPFLRVLVKALERPSENHCLVIEEINRANAAAVFGDVFQLLDRATEDSKKDTRVKKDESEYGVAASEDIRRYLTKMIGDAPETDYARTFLEVEKKTDGTIALDANGNWASCKLRIPSNMYIWATMNSADQGVFPMDTAFKRRWKFKYFEINQSDDKIEKRTIGTDLTIDGKPAYDTAKWNADMRNWNNVRKFVNRLLSLFKVNEDKLMGPWFVQPESGDVISAEQFESKVLMYLWEDAARMCRQKMFPNSVTSYSELITEWRKHGVGIFRDLMGDNQIGGKDKNNDNSASELWEELKVPKE